MDRQLAKTVMNRILEGIVIICFAITAVILIFGVQPSKTSAIVSTTTTEVVHETTTVKYNERNGDYDCVVTIFDNGSTIECNLRK